MIAGRLANRAAAPEAERVPYVQATVVRAGRPASVQPGATALVLKDGEIEGFVGGHCAEPSVRLHALRALETGEPLLLRIEPGDGDSEPTEGAPGGAPSVVSAPIRSILALRAATQGVENRKAGNLPSAPFLRSGR